MNNQSEQNIKIMNYKALNKTVQKGQILFTGSSLMEQFPVVELFSSFGMNKIVYNRGVGGFRTDDFLAEIDTMLFDLLPSKVFINIGTNDMHEYADGQDWKVHLLNNYRKILTMCKERLPRTEIIMMAYYPVNPDPSGTATQISPSFRIRNSHNLEIINHEMKQLAEEFKCQFINVNQGLTDNSGHLKSQYTMDGIHMYADAYTLVFKNLLPYL